VKPRVSVIIPHRNRLQMLKACLASLECQSFRDFEVIVVDNDSSDGSREWLRDQAGIEVVELSWNAGFTGANLAGLERAQGSFIAALNNDTEAESGWLESALAAFQQDPRVGIVASCLLNFQQPGLIDSAGDGLNRAGRGVKLGFGEPAAWHADSRYVFGACAAAAIYRRAMIEEIGFFDDAFYFNCEDVDLSARAQLAGWRCWYEARARVRHHISASHAELGREAIFYWSRNCELLWFKNMPLALWPLLIAPKVLQESLSFVRNAWVGPHTRAYLLGKLAALKVLPRLWGERRRIQRRRRLSLGPFYAMLLPSFDWPSVQARARRLAATLRA
jgi:GT2 family glycosyltransferase